MQKQNKELHYHEFCVGHGFLDTIEEGQTCNMCGDTDARYMFSFNNKEEFVDKYVYDEVADYYQDDEWTLTKEEVMKKVDGLDEYKKNAEEVYDDLIKYF